MRVLKWAAAVGVLTWAVAAAPASAGTLDQQQTTGDNGQLVGTCSPPGLLGCPNPAGAQRASAQTFTAGLSGPLDQIDVFVNLGSPPPTAPMTIEIRGVAPDGCPSTDVLATAALPPASVPIAGAWTPVAFANPTQVMAGTQYAIVLYTDVGHVYGVDWGPGDPYPAGRRCTSDVAPPASPPTTWTTPGAGGDLLFKTYVVVPPGPGGGGGGGGGGADGAPQTTITKSPPNKTKKSTAKFKFESDERNSTFECKLKGKGLKRSVKSFHECESPAKYKKLDPGKYKFFVFAIDATGKPDASPATDRFKVTD